jgi:Fic family protein
MKIDPEKPWNDLPLLPPAATLEPSTVLRQAARTHGVLGRLCGYCATLPNAGMLVDSLVIQEARSSSAIENIITTQDAVYRAMASDGTSDPAAREVIDYREALWKGYRLLKSQGSMSVKSIFAMQESIVHNDAGVRALPGTVLRNEKNGKVVYTPPNGRERIMALLSNLETYAARVDDVDPLVRMAVIHYQFESIHPFYDGNGRTGRILNTLYLVQRGLLDLPVLYLSREINERKDAYYRLLQEVRTKDSWEPWILFVLEAVERSSNHTLQLIRGIVDVLDRTLETCRSRLPRTTYSKELVERLFVQPYVKTEHLVKAGIAERRTATKYLRQLEEIGVLSSFKSWRETIFINTGLVKVLKE